MSVSAYEAGDYVKVELSDEASGESEWVWVRVEGCDERNRLIFGRLDSVPLLHVGRLKLRQQMAVSFDNIRDHMKR